MLGMYLQEELGISCDYVSGELGNRTHAWLELDGVVIDITSDQFAGGEPVIVSKDSEFHRRFEEVRRRTPSIWTAEGSHLGDLDHDYRLLLDTCESA